MRGDNPTTDLERFGNRELEEAAQLLRAYADSGDRITDIKAFFDDALDNRETT